MVDKKMNMSTTKLIGIMCGLCGIVTTILSKDILAGIWALAYTSSVLNWN